MKKLGKLTLKELGNAVMVSSFEDQKSIVAGSGWQMFEGNWTYMLDEVTVSAPKLVEIGDTGYYIPLSLINTSNPIDDQGSIGGLTHEQQFSQACAEGFTDAFNAMAAFGLFVGLTAFDAWCIIKGLGPIQGQSVINPDQYGSGSNTSY